MQQSTGFDEKLKQSTGFGDTLEKSIHKLQLDILSKFYTDLTGNTCKCAERKEYLNKTFPYSSIKQNKENL